MFTFQIGNFGTQSALVSGNAWPSAEADTKLVQGCYFSCLVCLMQDGMLKPPDESRLCVSARTADAVFPRMWPLISPLACAIYAFFYAAEIFQFVGQISLGITIATLAAVEAPIVKFVANVIAIADGSLMTGNLSSRALNLVQEWAIAHRGELLENWDLARSTMVLRKIEPLI